MRPRLSRDKGSRLGQEPAMRRHRDWESGQQGHSHRPWRTNRVWTEHSGGGLGTQQVCGGGQGGFSVLTEGGQIRDLQGKDMR